MRVSSFTLSLLKLLTHPADRPTHRPSDPIRSDPIRSGSVDITRYGKSTESVEITSSFGELSSQSLEIPLVLIPRVMLGCWWLILWIVKKCKIHLILIPRVIFGRRSGFWLIPWIVEIATSALCTPYCSLKTSFLTCNYLHFQFLLFFTSSPSIMYF